MKTKILIILIFIPYIFFAQKKYYSPFELMVDNEFLLSNRDTTFIIKEFNLIDTISQKKLLINYGFVCEVQKVQNVICFKQYLYDISKEKYIPFLVNYLFFLDDSYSFVGNIKYNEIEYKTINLITKENISSTLNDLFIGCLFSDNLKYVKFFTNLLNEDYCVNDFTFSNKLEFLKQNNIICKIGRKYKYTGCKINVKIANSHFTTP
jgi:hypothetical protein